MKNCLGLYDMPSTLCSKSRPAKNFKSAWTLTERYDIVSRTFHTNVHLWTPLNVLQMSAERYKHGRIRGTGTLAPLWYTVSEISGVFNQL